MESLINDLLKLGATRERLEIKLFGGGRILAGMTDVGARNIDFIRSYIQLEGYRDRRRGPGRHPAAQGRLFSGQRPRASCASCRPVENRIISHHEQLYLASLGNKAADGGDVELFD